MKYDSDELIDYVFGDLSVDRRLQLEADAKADAELAAQLRVLAAVVGCSSEGIPHEKIERVAGRYLCRYYSTKNAEQIVIGSILIDPEDFPEVARTLKASHFRDFRNRVLYEHICALNESTEISCFKLLERLHQAGDYQKIGGEKYLLHCVQWVPKPSQVVMYAEIVAEGLLHDETVSADDV